MADVRQLLPASLSDQAASDKSKVFTVALRKSPRGGLGLGIVKDGGRSTEPGFVRVHELYPGKPAQLSGRLRTGDVILKVNGVRLLGKSTAQALEILRAASGLVTLTIYRQQSEENGNLSASQSDLNQCCRTEPEGAAEKDSDSTSPTSRHARPSSSYLGTGALRDSTAALRPTSEPPLYANLQLVKPMPKPRLRKSKAQPQSPVVRDLVEPCDFDVVTDGRVFGDLYNGGFRGAKLPQDSAPDEPTSQCSRRHHSEGAPVAVAARSSSSPAMLLFDDAVNGLARQGSSRTVRSCFNSAMFADSCGDDDPSLTRWRATMLTEESDDSGLCHRSPAETAQDGEAKLIDAPSLEIECVSVKLNRGWHTKLGFSLQDCDPSARDTPNAPVVKAVYAGSLASRDGRIHVGDFLVQVNGCDFIGCCAKDAVNYIKKCRGMLQLLFIRVHKSDAAPDSSERDK